MKWAPGVINFDTPPPAFDSISSSSGSELGERGLEVFDPSDLSPAVSLCELKAAL